MKHAKIGLCTYRRELYNVYSLSIVYTLFAFGRSLSLGNVAG